MNLFKNYTYSWQEIGIFKLAMLSIGILIGAHWPTLVMDNLLLIAVVAIVSTMYTMYRSFSQ